MIGYIILAFCIYMVLDYARCVSGNPLGGMREFYLQYWYSLVQTYKCAKDDIKNKFGDK